MAAEGKPRIPLPKAWTGHVRSAVLHVIGLAQYATAYARSWAANSPNERMRLKAENDRLEAEIAVLSVTTFWSFLREFSPLSRARL